MIDLQIFHDSGIWTPPSGVQWIKAIIIGAGGGGASGNISDLSPNPFEGGGGGGGGGCCILEFLPNDIISNTVTVGKGGLGGAALTGNAYIDKNAGVPGGNSNFNNCDVSGGGGGIGGVGPGYIAGGQGANAMWPGQNGGAAANSGFFGASDGISTFVYGGAGGGGGGGNSVGGNGGAVYYSATTGGAGGNINTLVGEIGELSIGEFGSGGGGGGFSGAANVGGYDGGAGGAPAGGGGGGGAAYTTGVIVTSGAGGNGADGVVIIISYL
jgi:hypothetical protein